MTGDLELGLDEPDALDRRTARGRLGAMISLLTEDVIDPKYERVDWMIGIHALDAGGMDVHDVIVVQAADRANMPSRN